MQNDAAANYDISRQTELRLRDKSTRNSGVVYVVGTKPFVFDPLDNGSPVLYIDNQRVSQLDKCQEAGSEGGLGRGVSLHIGM